ncbi:FkbM family methyltransferase [Aquiflexum sp. TKW24L]|uniref:FkbM family methyltransferase n=1 Tax=Aquiflexum sp. TKW24L TaxID=2942212 RepID=UPI0020C0BCEB|nr:FkbM family methyltransferase [Aquiflexum sp. TKW24L]MCL6261223.1 FkbM family methyltransferase [Aquiflexum sp. TKW24L]
MKKNKLKGFISKGINSWINSFPYIFSHFVGYSFLGRILKVDVTKTLEKNFPNGSKFTFIQIGANDGITFDFLYKILNSVNSRGLVIEPSPKYFPKVVENLSSLGEIIFVQKAIYSKNQNVTLYEVNENGLKSLPEWGSGLGSLNQRHLLNHNISTDNIDSYEVEGITFETLMNNNPGFNKVDYLVIDVEGYDFEILKSIDFKEFDSKIIQFEIFNLNEDDKKASRNLMKEQGYLVFNVNVDLFCVKNRSDLYLKI